MSTPNQRVEAALALGDRELAAKLLRDAYECVCDLMPGIGRLAIAGSRIARINETLVCIDAARSRLGVAPPDGHSPRQIGKELP